MAAKTVLFARRYRAALLDYLLGSSETGLARAYDLGRSAVDEGWARSRFCRRIRRQPMPCWSLPAA